MLFAPSIPDTTAADRRCCHAVSGYFRRVLRIERELREAERLRFASDLQRMKSWAFHAFALGIAIGLAAGMWLLIFGPWEH